MNFSLKNLSIKAWIIGNATLLLLLILIISLTSSRALYLVGVDLKSLTKHDIPISKNVADIALNQLQQALHVERAKSYSKQQNKITELNKEVAGFNTTTNQINQEILRSIEVADEAIKQTSNQAKVKEFKRIKSLLKSIEREHKEYVTATNKVFSLFSQGQRQEVEQQMKTVTAKEDQLNKKLEALLAEREAFVLSIDSTTTDHEQETLNLLIAMSIVALLLGAFVSFLSVRNVIKPLNRIQQTVDAVAAGDFDAHIALDTTNELGQIASSFDKLLDDRLTTLAQIEKESKALNRSIVGLLQTVASLSQRDLTVNAAVTEDIAGTVADALNQLTTETAKVLNNVKHISGEVATTSKIVKSQSDLVSQFAEKERQVVDIASQTLQRTTDNMQDVAELTKRSNQTAERAIASTEKAFATVTDTVQGINDTRDTIRETEKRIKRLGERSQEINTAVNLINTIAERTHILALNASMQAASAGEAGRRFAVVADEVQRLAESSHDATAEIATLVKNIQVETSETVNTMNNTITQVVAGSRLAQQAGEEMQLTQKNTAELVAQVQEIAQKTQAQVAEVKNLENNIDQIRESTVETGKQLGEQANLTSNLVEFSTSLVKAVSVFKLPKDSTSAIT